MIRLPLPLRRFTAVATVAALLAGCASPYRFSSRLDTRLPADEARASAASEPLAGDLHLSLAALMDQRRQLWQAAGETEQMKNATALGLIGLTSIALYRGLQGEQSRGWLTRAGLLASATYTGANWLEPSARQRIYLAGAVSLTCLALVTAPYEMPLWEYHAIRKKISNSRAALEELASALRLVGQYNKHSDSWWLVRGGWNKLRWASRVLDSADAAIGNIEHAGPRLRDMTAMLASEVATQVNRVSKDLTEVTSAIAALKPNANLLIGSEVFPPPKKDEVDEDAPGSASRPDDAGKPDTTTPKTGETKDAQCTSPAVTPGVVAPKPETTQELQAAVKAANGAASQAVSAAASAASSAASSAATAAAASRMVQRLAGSAPKQAETTADVSLAQQAAAKVRHQQRVDAWEARLLAAAAHLDKHLGPVTSFVQRVAAARSGPDLPAACGTGAVTLVPGKRDVVLQPGESFQFVLQGDSGKAGADILGTAVPRDVLDLSLPLAQASTAVRLTAGARVPKIVNTVVRITDSKGRQNFDVNVKVCPGGS